MQFTTPVLLPTAPFQLTPQSRVLVLGSCFAEHIGQHLVESLPAGQVVVNPFGVVYGEGVLCQSLQSLLSPSSVFDEALYFSDEHGLWHSWAHSGAFNAESRAACVTSTTTALRAAQQLLRETNLLIITLSTDRHYRLVEEAASGVGEGATSTDQAVPLASKGVGIVANCHKQPSTRFREEADGLAEQMARWEQQLSALFEAHPGLQVLFTLSPYRYAKYGLHENQISKAKLLLLIDSLCRRWSACHYFPAYEIVLDELRDYRFYKPDLLHPSQQAIDYVWERFYDWAAASELRDYAHQRRALLRDLQHRPLHPESSAHQIFLKQLEQRIASFEKRWGTPLI